jgi:hypothetical protein
MNSLTVAHAKRWRRHHTIALISPLLLFAVAVIVHVVTAAFLDETQQIVLDFSAFMLICASFLWAPIVRWRIFHVVNPDGHLRSDADTFSLFQFPFGSVMMVSELLDAATGGKLRAGNASN